VVKPPNSRDIIETCVFGRREWLPFSYSRGSLNPSHLTWSLFSHDFRARKQLGKISWLLQKGIMRSLHIKWWLFLKFSSNT
jgi:hypothetical protein